MDKLDSMIHHVHSPATHQIRDKYPRTLYSTGTVQLRSRSTISTRGSKRYTSLPFGIIKKITTQAKINQSTIK